ncbi:response regulator [Pedobacter polaris]|uniref:Response regulator n=1 Tax=Pedobacter polaris TaxID=2571273 RepID=A0A4U1CSC6_9SPHI|nr:histidine kinase [Pedobacter polaris]TKC10654.1 response regulator [Pedobacter polaris]
MEIESGYQILVVEDNPGDFFLVEELIIERINAPVIIQAKTFMEAEAQLMDPTQSYKVVLLDLSLPDNSGERLIKEMVKLCGDVPVIVLTGHLDFYFGVKSLSMGVSDYLLKDGLTSHSLYKSIIYSTERRKFIAALEASERRVRGFAGRLNKAIEDERARIAREIHDEFGQQLTGLKMSLSALKRNEKIDDELRGSIDLMISEVNGSIDSVRQIANELRPVLIDKLGLFVAIDWLVAEFGKKTGILSQLNIEVSQPKIDKETEINIFRICQEALTNIAKHAMASVVDVWIGEQEGQLLIRIVDNGKGIMETFLQNPLSMGLNNMKERASLIGGVLKITSIAMEGTTIELTLK